MNVQRIMAIFEKDLKDFMKNTMIVFMAATPLMLALLYGFMDFGDELPLFMI